MAEAHSTSVPTAVATAVPKSQSNPAPNDTDSLKQELINVKRTLECLVQAVQNLSGTEVQAVPSISPTKTEIKHESIEIDLGDTSDTIPTSTYAPDNDQIKIKGEESEEGAQTDGEQSEEGKQPKNTSDDGDEVIATIRPRRESTEEPIWPSCPIEEVLFRVNPDYARQIASRTGAVTEPVWVPTPLRTPPTEIVIKDEHLEVELGNNSDLRSTPAQQHASDRDQTEFEDEEIGDDDQSENAYHDVSNDIATTPARQESTEEFLWPTPPLEEVLFRVNLEYARRMASLNMAVTEPIQVPIPPRIREEISSLSLRSSPPPPVASPTSPAETTPVPQTKRKHSFEPFEVSSKRFNASKASNSSDALIAFSSHDRSVKSNAVTTSAEAPGVPGQEENESTATSFNVTLQPRIRDVLVPRRFLAAQFGANRIQAFTICQEHWINKHGYDHFVFLCESNSPKAPSAPGEPGIVIHFDGNQWPSYDLYRVFARMSTSPAKWQYVGLYKSKILPPWSPEEVTNQPRLVRSHWAKRVRDSMWGRPIIARIVLRIALDREPTPAEVNDQVEKIEADNAELPSLNAIMTAFEKGEEIVYPWELECKGYEENLQWEIAVTFPYFKKDFQKKFNAST